MNNLSHTEKMNIVWSRIEQLPITTDEKKYETDPNSYFLVRDIDPVRYAIYADFFVNEVEDNEDLPMFFERHNILFKG